MKDFVSANVTDFRVLFEWLPGLYLALLPDFTIAAASEKFLEATMLTREEISERGVFEVFPADFSPSANGEQKLLFSLEKVLQTKKPDGIAAQRFSVRRRSGNDEVFEKNWDALNSPVLDENGQVRYIIVSFQDATESRKIESRKVETAKAESRIARQSPHSFTLENEARSARKKLKQILAGITDSFYSFDRELRYTYVNRATTEMFGIAEKDFLGKSLWDLFPDVEGNCFHEELKRALAEQKTAVFENYYAPLDRWFENRVYPSEDGLSVFTSEITDRKRIELKLQETNAVLNAININTPTLIYVKDRESRILSANPATCDVLGKPLQEIVGKSPNEYIGDEAQAELIRLNDLRIIERGKTETFEEEVEMPDGKHVFLSTKTPYRSQQGEIIGLIGVSVDITSRKLSEEKLHTANERFRVVAQVTNDAIWDWNLATNKLAWNDGVQTLFGYPPEQISDSIDWWYEHIHSQERDAVVESIHEVIENGGLQWAKEYRFVKADGSFAEVLDRGYVIRDAAGNALRMLGGMTDMTERRLAEERLRESEQRLLQMANSMPQVVWIAESDGTVVYYNERVSGLSGISQNAEGNWSWQPVLHPDDLEDTVECWKKSVSQKTAYSKEHRIKMKDGSFRWHLSRAFPFFNKDGETVNWYGTATDIHDLKLAEEKLRESEEKFRNLADNISQLAWMTDASGGIFWYNERWFEYTGTTLEEVRDWGWQKVHHPDHLERVTNRFKQAIEKGEAWEDTFPLRSKTGEYRWFLSRALPIRDKSGKILRWFGTNTDVTEIRQTRRELEEANALLDTLFDEAPIGFGYWDEKLRFSRVNRALAEMNGFSVEEHLGKTVAELLPEVADGVMQAFQRVVETGEALVNIEAEGKTPAARDEYRYWNVSYYPINLEGKTAGVGAVCEEITERKKAEVEREKLLKSEQEARLQAEQANRLKDEFLATVSHELRTPLNAMLGWSSIVRQGGYQPETMRRAFEIVERNARNQEQIIADILDVSRIITGKLNIEAESVELVSIVRAAIDTVRPAIEAKRINLLTDFSEDAQLITGDASRLQQIVWNLLSNAAKFTPEGEVIFVSVRQGDGQFAEIVIRDTGEGIEPEFLPFVFDRFRQADGGSNRKHGGLGLGLAIVRHLVELHGGEVSVESEGRGRGASFIVKIPLFAAYCDYGEANKQTDSEIAEEKTQSPAASEKGALKGVGVLVVDDEPDALELIKIMLEEQGAIVTTTTTVADALEKLESEDFDVLISDLGMPVEDGFDLIRKVKASKDFAEIPAIAVTAYAREEDSLRSLEAGFAAHLSKPYSIEDLTESIRSLIE